MAYITGIQCRRNHYKIYVKRLTRANMASLKHSDIQYASFKLDPKHGQNIIASVWYQGGLNLC